MLTVEQIRAARALTGWSQKGLGERANLSQTAITNIEVGKFRPTAQSSAAIKEAFEAAGIEFIPGGVRRRPSAIISIQGEDYAQQIMDWVYAQILAAEDGEGHEILMTGVDYSALDASMKDHVRAHIDRLQQAGIDQHILVAPDVKEQDILGPKTWHRRIDRRIFGATTPTMIFGEYYGMMLQDQKEWLVIKNRNLADNQRHVFQYLWDNAEVL
jgi:transcriptional regulator with XRE-family HTH domain